MYGDCQVMHHSSTSRMMMGGDAGGGGAAAAADHMGVGMDMGMGMGMSMGMNMNMNMGMGMPSHDPLFPSQGNPSPHFTTFMSSMGPFHHPFPSIIPKEETLMMRKEDEMESGGSGSGQLEGLSCGEEHDNGDQGLQYQQHHLQHQQQQQDEPNQAKKKRYHRHTAHQIQEMEALFKECPHPDDKQRLRLSQELGLKPRQVKFWFQNRRTQLKAQQDRSDNVILRAENDSLKNENFRLQTALRNISCPNCGGPAMIGELSYDEQHLRIENARLKEELDRLSCIAARYTGGRPVIMAPSLDLDMGLYGRHFPEMDVVPPVISPVDEGRHQEQQQPSMHQQQQQPEMFGGGFVMEQNKGAVAEMAVAATEQLVRMFRADGRMWAAGACAGEVVNVEEYVKVFDQQLKGDVRVEGTRDRGHVIMNSITLVDAFLDADKWMELFPTIVSTARTLQIISPGVGGSCNGSMQLMFVEFKVLSPLVPAREAYFFRYCQQNAEEGFWTIVDFPAEGLDEALQATTGGYKRKPSGCLLQDMPNGYSMVTWVELAEVEDKPLHKIFDDYVRSGAAYGANRWLSALQQQCDRLASLMARNVADLGVIPTPEARKNIMRLSQRMIRTFFHNITPSSLAQPWTSLSDSVDETVRIMTRKNTDPGQPNGVILAAVSTAWLPFSHLQVFELLTDEKRRSQLDALSCGNSIHEIAHIANGSHQKNCVSLFRISASSNSSQNVELMLQESTTHPTGGSMVVYATIDVDAVQVAMGGEDPSYIALLPTGFVVLPAPRPDSIRTSNESVPEDPSIGCLLTIGLQVLASAVPSAKLNLSSVAAVNNLLTNAIHQIDAALGGTGPTAIEPSATAASPSASEP